MKEEKLNELKELYKTLNMYYIKIDVNLANVIVKRSNIDSLKLFYESYIEKYLKLKNIFNSYELNKDIENKLYKILLDTKTHFGSLGNKFFITLGIDEKVVYKMINNKIRLPHNV